MLMQCYINDRRCVLVSAGDPETYSAIIISVDGKPVSLNYDSCVRDTTDDSILRSEFEDLAELCVSIADDWILSEQEIDLCTAAYS